MSSNPNGQPRTAGRGGTSRPRDTFLHVTAALSLATYDELLALPDGERGEIVRGSLVLAPAPLPRHSKVQGALRRFIGGAFDDDDGRGGPGGWWVLLEVDVRLGRHDIVRPDLAGWRRERLLDPWDLRPIDVVPDWGTTKTKTTYSGSASLIIFSFPFF